MTQDVYWAGSDQTEWTLTGGGTVSATPSLNTLFRAAWQRNATSCSNSSSNSNPPPNRIQTTGGFKGGAISTFWYNCQVGFVSVSASQNTNAQIVRFLDTSGVMRLCLRCASSSVGAWKLSKCDSGGTFTDLLTLTPATPSNNTPYPLSIYVDDSVTGTIKVYFDQVLLGTYTGDTTTEGISTLQYVELVHLGQNQTVGWSEVVIGNFSMNTDPAGSDEGGLFLGVSKDPNTTAGWTINSGGLDQGPNSFSTTHNIATSSTGDPYLLPTLEGTGYINTLPTAPMPGWVIPALITSIYAETSGTPANIETALQIGATVYTSGSFAPGGSYAPNPAPNILPTNPATSAAWTVGDFTGLNYGVQCS